MGKSLFKPLVSTLSISGSASDCHSNAAICSGNRSLSTSCLIAALPYAMTARTPFA